MRGIRSRLLPFSPRLSLALLRGPWTGHAATWPQQSSPMDTMSIVDRTQADKECWSSQGFPISSGYDSFNPTTHAHSLAVGQIFRLYAQRESSVSSAEKGNGVRRRFFRTVWEISDKTRARYSDRDGKLEYDEQVNVLNPFRHSGSRFFHRHVGDGVARDTKICNDILKALGDLERHIGARKRGDEKRSVSKIVRERLEPWVDGVNDRIVLEVLKELNDPEVSLSFFHWSSSQGSISPTSIMYDGLISILGKSKHVFSMEEVLWEMEVNGIRPIVETFNSILQAYDSTLMFDKAISIHEKMRKLGVRLNAVTYSHLICIYSGAGLPEKAWNMYQKMKEEGFPLPLESVPEMMTIFYTLKMRDEAEELFASTPTCESHLETKIFYWMIKIHFEHGNSERALELVDTFLSQPRKWDDPMHDLLLLISQRKNMKEMFDFLMETWKKLGNQLDQSWFCAKIQSRLNQAEYQAAEDMFSKLSEKGIDADVQIYNLMLLVRIRSKNWDGARKLVRDMIVQQIVVPLDLYSSVFQELSELKGEEEKAQILRVLELLNHPIHKLFPVLCVSSLRRKDKIRFQTMKESMDGLAEEPQDHVYAYFNALIDYLCKNRLKRNAILSWTEFRDRGYLSKSLLDEKKNWIFDTRDLSLFSCLVGLHVELNTLYDQFSRKKGFLKNHFMIVMDPPENSCIQSKGKMKHTKEKKELLENLLMFGMLKSPFSYKMGYADTLCAHFDRIQEWFYVHDFEKNLNGQMEHWTWRALQNHQKEEGEKVGRKIKWKKKGKEREGGWRI